jgi:hypothetical protein
MAGASRLERNIRTGISGADDEDVPGPELQQILVVSHVQLRDRRIELARERRDPGPLEIRHGHNDVLRLEVAIASDATYAFPRLTSRSMATPVRTGSAKWTAYASR